MDDFVSKRAPVPPAASMRIQTSQLLRDGTHFFDRYGSETRNLFRIGGAKYIAQALQVEDVADKGHYRVLIDKVAVQHGQESAQLDHLPGLFGDLPIKRRLDSFPAFDAACGQSIYGLFVAVLRVKQDFAAGLAYGEYHLAPSVRIRLASIGAQIGVGFKVIPPAKRLPKSFGKGLNFRLVYARFYI